MMNVTFVTGNEDLDKKFPKEAEKAVLVRSVAVFAVGVGLAGTVLAVLMSFSVTGASVLMGFVAVFAVLMGAGFIACFTVEVLGFVTDKHVCRQCGDLENAEYHDQGQQEGQTSPSELCVFFCHYFVLLSNLESEISAAAPP